MPPSNERDADRPPPERRHSEGPFSGLLGQIPLQSRLALTIGAVVGLFASIVLSQTSDRASQVALWVGVGGGLVAAVVLWIRAKR
ncbi:MAG TPA: hypothetical protein VKB09_13865 [Thermomicrobiales bacterium]|nr:hypothetical protein [Thermomicrobiales bacterium]